MPWLTGEPLHWPYAIGTSMFIAMSTYLIRTRPARFMANFLAGVSLFALGVYSALMRAQGIPKAGSDRLGLAFVVAIPCAGLILAWRIYRQPRSE